MASPEATKQVPQATQPAAAARLILFITVFIDLLGFGIVIPLLPMFAPRWAFSFTDSPDRSSGCFSLVRFTAHAPRRFRPRRPTSPTPPTSRIARGGWA